MYQRELTKMFRFRIISNQQSLLLFKSTFIAWLHFCTISDCPFCNFLYLFQSLCDSPTSFFKNINTKLLSPFDIWNRGDNTITASWNNGRMYKLPLEIPRFHKGCCQTDLSFFVECDYTDKRSCVFAGQNCAGMEESRAR